MILPRLGGLAQAAAEEGGSLDLGNQFLAGIAEPLAANVAGDVACMRILLSWKLVERRAFNRNERKPKRGEGLSRDKAASAQGEAAEDAVLSRAALDNPGEHPRSAAQEGGKGVTV